MSKSRVPSTKRKACGPLDLTTKQTAARYLGLSLSGGKADKTCLAVLDYYPEQGRIFLSGLHDKIKSEQFISADKKIVEMIEQLKEGARFLAFDAPLSLPLCAIQCSCKGMGYETCNEPQIKWMRQIYQSQPKKKPRKMFTPYTQRPVDLYLSEIEEENLEVQHALGANSAPLAGRAIFLKQRMTLPCLEVFPKLALWRMGQELRINRKHLLSYRNSVGGEEARRLFLQALVDRAGLFLYLQDQKTLIESTHAFDSLMCAWVAFLKDQDKTELKPKDFPKEASWVEFPKPKVF